MFTGIIESIGTVRSAERRGDVLVVRLAPAPAGLAPGGSIAVNGCCLTAVALEGDGGFACELTEETLRRTAFEQRLRPGAIVNLERPMRADGRFDGHIVQGHVDAVGRVLSLTTLGESAELVVTAPPSVLRYLVEKGSIAVEGVSLTVARLAGDTFTIALIPFTLVHTSLGGVRGGDPVNLEIDVVAKYVERLLPGAGR